MEAVGQRFAGYVQSIPTAARITLLHDVDADGIAAAVVLEAALARVGYTAVTRLMPDRTRNAWSPEVCAAVAATEPERLFVLDLGSQPQRIVPVPTGYIDHHRPGGAGAGDLLISGYEMSPIPTSSLLAYECASALADVSELEWVTALGILSDIGDKAPFALLERAKKVHTARWLKEATTLVNAIRRSSRFNPEAAVRAIEHHDGPKALVEDDGDPDVALLKEAREEVKAAMAEAKKSAPKFSGNIALIRMNSRCQVHPLIAQIWRTRLPKYAVIAANEGYLPGRVNFSARASGETSVIDLLRSFKISDGEGSYGHGHEQASGGSLEVARWNELLAAMGFEPTVFAS